MLREIEQKPIIYREYWVVRVVHDTGKKKRVVDEVPYDMPPTQQDIVDILTEHNKECFVSLEHNFKLI